MPTSMYASSHDYVESKVCEVRVVACGAALCLLP